LGLLCPPARSIIFFSIVEHGSLDGIIIIIMVVSSTRFAMLEYVSVLSSPSFPLQLCLSYYYCFCNSVACLLDLRRGRERWFGVVVVAEEDRSSVLTAAERTG
jgi:hypothetical protein